jgi:hypothetical protein
MTLTQETQTLRRRDRWADWAVIALVTVALILGWALREATLFRTMPFTLDEAEITGQCPANWVRETGDDPLLQARDPLGGEFDPVLALRSRPLAAEVEAVMALDALALERAQRTAAYQSLDTVQVLVDGKVATKRTFAYVHTDTNPYVDRLPVVVRGSDLALRDGGRVVIVTLLSDADDFEAYQRHFQTFAKSLEF